MWRCNRVINMRVSEAHLMKSYGDEIWGAGAKIGILVVGVDEHHGF
jgi:hypothetical protein